MKWQVVIDSPSTGGFAPGYYKESYPTFGNKNNAAIMTNIDMTNPGFFQQGSALSAYSISGGGGIVTLLKGIVEYPDGVNSYAVGGNEIEQFTTSSVIAAHTISDAGSEMGEDVCIYDDYVYYSFNESGQGQIGRCAAGGLSCTDTWWTGTGATALASGVPHQLVAGGDDILYCANGRDIASWDSETSTAQDKALLSRLPVDSVILSMAWMSDRLWVLATRPNNTIQKDQLSIYIWDGTTDSWETEIKFSGIGGALHVKNGVLYLWYQDLASTSDYKIAYISGSSIVDLVNYSGGLPMYYQITDYKGFILFVAGQTIMAYGAGDIGSPVRLFQIATARYTTPGGLACPFGIPLIASNQSSSYAFDLFNALTTTSTWKSITFDVAGMTKVPATLQTMRVNFNKLTSGASVGIKLVNNQGVTLYSDTISYAKATATIPAHTLTSAFFPLNSGIVCENLRVELDYSTGSTSASVQIKKITISGTN